MTPILMVGLAVGLTVSIFQAVTQIQEQTLTFVPKILAMGVTLMVIVPWIGGRLIEFTMRMCSTSHFFEQPSVVRVSCRVDAQSRAAQQSIAIEVKFSRLPGALFPRDFIEPEAPGSRSRARSLGVRLGTRSM